MNIPNRFSHTIWLRRVPSPLGGFFWSLAFLGVMFWFRYQLEPHFKGQFPYITFILGIALSSLFVGWKPAAVVMVIGYFLSERFFLSGNFYPANVISLYGAIFYFATNSIIIAYSEAAYRGLTRSVEAGQKTEQIAGRFRLATEAMQGMVYEWDVLGNRVERSAGLKSLLGYDEDTDEPTPEWWQERLHPEDRERIQNFNPEAEVGQVTFEMEYRICDKQGAYRWVADKCLVTRDAAGKVVRIVGCAMDITERKSAESALYQRTNEVEQLNVRLRRAMQETHHRVKNNLQVIVSLTDISLDANPQSVPAKDVRRIGHNTQTLAAIHDILTQNVKQNADMDRVSTQEVWDKLIPLIESTLGKRAIQYQTDDVVLPVLQGESLALLVSELIANSVKHGAGIITVALRCNPLIETTSLTLTVQDQGKGFPPDFNPKRAANIGLELITSLAEFDLRGKLHYSNVPSGGACVQVVFPVPPLPGEPTERRDDSATPIADKFPTPIP